MPLFPLPSLLPPERHTSALSRIVGTSSAIANVRRLIVQAGPTHLSVLIVGESGTGKELVAAALASLSTTHHEPYVSVNCAAISSEVAESELFGHERGAFTGAHGSRQGLFEEANGGTLFLDEVGDLPLGLQPKLLRVLETGRLRRVGGRGEAMVNVRVLAATHRFDDRHLRVDLYHRLAQVVVALPPLRERMDDLGAIACTILGQDRLAADVLAKLSAYDWPGNVRELRNVLVRACLLAEGRELRPEHIWFDPAHRQRSYPSRESRVVGAMPLSLSAPMRAGGPSARAGTVSLGNATGKASATGEENETGQAAEPAERIAGSGQLHLEALVGKITLEAMADEAISIALRRSRGNRRQAARILGIPRTTLGERVRRARSRTAKIEAPQPGDKRNEAITPDADAPDAPGEEQEINPCGEPSRSASCDE